MKELTNNELWERIKHLQGSIIYTIERQNPNNVVEVTDDEIRLTKSTGKPRTGVLRDEIVNTYRYLIRHGEVTGDDFKNIPQHRTWGLNGRIILAILREAVPGQIVDFQRSPNVLKSGIRLKQD